MELWPVLPTDQLVRSKNVAIIMKKKKKKTHKNTKNNQTTRSAGKIKNDGWFLCCLRKNGLWMSDKRALGPSRAASAAIFRPFRITIHEAVACAVCLSQRELLKRLRPKCRAMLLLESARTYRSAWKFSCSNYQKVGRHMQSFCPASNQWRRMGRWAVETSAGETLNALSLEQSDE